MMKSIVVALLLFSVSTFAAEPSCEKLTTFNPSINKEGFEFLDVPVWISKEESAELIQFFRQVFKDNGKRPRSFEGPLIPRHPNLESHTDGVRHSAGYKLLAHNNHSVLTRLRSQVRLILDSPGNYLPEYEMACGPLNVELRVGFKENDLYIGDDAEVYDMHTDEAYSRLLITVLGSTTIVEAESKIHVGKTEEVRTPADKGLLISGRQRPYPKVTRHRAPYKREDRLLIVFTCNKKSAIFR